MRSLIRYSAYLTPTSSIAPGTASQFKHGLAGTRTMR